MFVSQYNSNHCETIHSCYFKLVKASSSNMQLFQEQVRCWEYQIILNILHLHKVCVKSRSGHSAHTTGHAYPYYVVYPQEKCREHLQGSTTRLEVRVRAVKRWENRIMTLPRAPKGSNCWIVLEQTTLQLPSNLKSCHKLDTTFFVKLYSHTWMWNVQAQVLVGATTIAACKWKGSRWVG